MEKSAKMFDKVKRCSLSHKMMIRLNNFLYIFNLRQGTIVIAVHQIALTSFVLLILLVGMSHVGEMLRLLSRDMEDDADRREAAPRHADNNRRRFASAEHLASVTVVCLYSSTALTGVYLLSCVSLLLGAVRRRRALLLPWLACACACAALLALGVAVVGGFPTVVDLFGGRVAYYFGSTVFVLTFIYAICVVSSFALETGPGGCGGGCGGGGGGGGERLMLLDHAAHSSLLSAAQLRKLSGTRSQFV